jgi:phage protein D
VKVKGENQSESVLIDRLYQSGNKKAGSRPPAFPFEKVDVVAVETPGSISATTSATPTTVSNASSVFDKSASKEKVDSTYKNKNKNNKDKKEYKEKDDKNKAANKFSDEDSKNRDTKNDFKDNRKNNEVPKENGHKKELACDTNINSSEKIINHINETNYHDVTEENDMDLCLSDGNINRNDILIQENKQIRCTSQTMNDACEIIPPQHNDTDRGVNNSLSKSCTLNGHIHNTNHKQKSQIINI